MKGKASGFTAYTVSGAIKIAQQTSSVLVPTLGPPGLDGADGDDKFVGFPTIQTVNSVIPDTNTGAVTNWTPALNGNTFIIWTGASDVTFQGLSKGFVGQVVTIKNKGTKNAFFVYNSGTTTLAAFLNIVTGGVTPIAPGGYISYLFDGTNWLLVEHCQGDFINVPYLAGNFTTEGAGTWTVEAADVFTYSYYLDGKRLSLLISIQVTSVTRSGGSPTQLRITLPNGYVASGGPTVIYRALDNGVNVISSMDIPSTSYIRCFATVAGAQWATSIDATYVLGEIYCSII